MKTTKEIIEKSQCECDGWEESSFANVKWYSEKELRLKLLDMYRFMCNEYGKGDVWSMDADELLNNVDLLIEKILFNKPEK